MTRRKWVANWLVSWSLFATCVAVCGYAIAAEPTNEPPKKLRIVVFGAHCDDCELGAGGLMRMLADQGHEVISAYATAFRRGRMIDGKTEESVRRAESTAACQILGATPHFFPYAHEDLEKPFAEKKTLIDIIAWLDEVKPDIVLAHWPLDTHPNHQVVGMTTWMAYDHAGRVWGARRPPAKSRQRRAGTSTTMKSTRSRRTKTSKRWRFTPTYISTWQSSRREEARVRLPEEPEPRPSVGNSRQHARPARQGVRRPLCRGVLPGGSEARLPAAAGGVAAQAAVTTWRCPIFVRRKWDCPLEPA